MSDTKMTVDQALLNLSTAIVNQTAAVHDLAVRQQRAQRVDTPRVAQIADMIGVVQKSTDELVALANTLPPNPEPVPQPPWTPIPPDVEPPSPTPEPASP